MPDKNEADNKTDGAELALSLASVALTLPQFWCQNPDSWFVKAEALMKTSNIIAEETKFNKVVAILPENVAVQVREVTHKATYVAGDYEKLKALLIKRNHLSTIERMDKLGELKEIEGKKPSDLLIDLECIITSSIDGESISMDDKTKKYWWLRALPKALRPSLLVLADSCALPKLVDAADTIYLSGQQSLAVSAVSQASQVSSPSILPSPLSSSPENDDLVDKVIAALDARKNKRGPRNSGPKSKQQNLSIKPTALLCTYHVKFGDQAYKCAPGCSKYSKNQ